MHLEDYTSAELAAIATQRAKSEYGMRLEGVLEGKLARHIEEHHSLRMGSENASLAVHLVEEALDRRASRVNQARRRGEEGVEEGLMPEDFEIHEVPLERMVAEKEAVEAEIAGLVGMAAGKRCLT